MTHLEELKGKLEGKLGELMSAESEKCGPRYKYGRAGKVEVELYIDKKSYGSVNPCWGTLHALVRAASAQSTVNRAFPVGN